MTRRLGILMAAGLVMYGFVCARNYRSRPSSDRAIASQRIKTALKVLEDPTNDPDRRLSSYRANLLESENWLQRAVRKAPLDVVSLERLALVRWELEVLSRSMNADPTVRLIKLAGERAPRIPDVQLRLGRLLYQVGNPEEAFKFMQRAAASSADTIPSVVLTMANAGMDAPSILDALPNSGASLLAVRDGFQREGKLLAWIQRAEPLIASQPSRLISAYAEACTAVDMFSRLILNLEELGEMSDPWIEAERLIALANAHARLGTSQDPASEAERACTLASGNPWLLEAAGRAALTFGRPAAAERAFSAALSLHAGAGHRETERGRLYRWRGESFGQLGRVEAAIDDYCRALTLLPDDPWLQKRCPYAAQARR